MWEMSSAITARVFQDARAEMKYKDKTMFYRSLSVFIVATK
jgi:hypothetical protein